MRRTAGKVLVAGSAVAMVAVFVPAASAFGNDTIHGGCYTNGVSNFTLTQSQNVGVIGDNSVTTTGDTPPQPIAATVECWIQVNGVDATPHYTYSGTGAQSGQNQISYSASPTDEVDLCQAVHYADGDSPWVCNSASQSTVPHQLGDFDSAYCPYGSIVGTGSWTPPETATLAPHVFVWDTSADCIGAGDDSGSYHVVFTGSANDACTAGSGSGTISGSGPEGLITGSFTFFRGGIHLYISGSFLSGGEQHSLQYWLDVLASTGGVCSYAVAPLIGHGAIADPLPA